MWDNALLSVYMNKSGRERLKLVTLDSHIMGFLGGVVCLLLFSDQ